MSAMLNNQARTPLATLLDPHRQQPDEPDVDVMLRVLEDLDTARAETNYFQTVTESLKRAIDEEKAAMSSMASSTGRLVVPPGEPISLSHTLNIGGRTATVSTLISAPNLLADGDQFPPPDSTSPGDHDPDDDPLPSPEDEPLPSSEDVGEDVARLITTFRDWAAKFRKGADGLVAQARREAARQEDRERRRGRKGRR